jgi:hypothetical protein
MLSASWRNQMRTLTLPSIRTVPIAAVAAPAGGQAASQDLRWLTGNTHAQSLNSDGDLTPADLVAAYRGLGYHFPVITDHNFVTPVEGLNALHGAEQRFLVLRGQEVTDKVSQTRGGKSVNTPIHLNLLGGNTLIQPQGGSSPAEALQRDIDEMKWLTGTMSENSGAEHTRRRHGIQWARWEPLSARSALPASCW